jgi:hypothetical protein
VSHRIYEFAIPLSLLQASPGDVLGFLGRSTWDYGVYDDTESASSSWPVYFSGSPAIDQFGELELAISTLVPPTTTASVAGAAGTSGWYKSAVSITLSATGGTGGIDYTQYRVDGGSWMTYSSAISISADGTHTLDYRSVDLASQVETTKSLTIKIDKVAPTTSSAVSGANLWLNVTDATSGSASVKYRIDNGTWQTYTGMLSLTGAGTHTVEFYSTDAAGNQESTDTVTVVVEEDETTSGLSSAVIWIGLLAAIAAAMLILLLVLMKRRKGQQPDQIYPPPMQPEQLPPPAQ